MKFIFGLAAIIIINIPTISPRGCLSIWLLVKVAVTVVPLAGSESIITPPPVSSVWYFRSGRPNPIFRLVLVVTKGLVTVSAISSGIPIPLSLTLIIMYESAEFGFPYLN